MTDGRSGGHPSFIAKGLFPKPPQLLEIDDQINDDPIGEAYWKIKNGIRLSGMPGFVDSLSARNIISAELTGVIGEQSQGDPKKKCRI